MLGLKEKVVIVAGASQGIGFATALAFAKAGAKVSICSRNEKKISLAAEKIREITGSEIFHSAVDLNDVEQINNFVEVTLRHRGTIHVCITNSGGPPMSHFMATTDDMWLEAFNSLLMSAIRLSRAVIPTMQEQKWGRIIHVSSITVRNLIPTLLLSNVIRPAVVALAKSQADELSIYNILVNSILPGLTDTERGREIIAEKATRQGCTIEDAILLRTNPIPLRRMATPEEIAHCIVFLASECASFVTGSALTVDGGETRFAF